MRSSLFFSSSLVLAVVPWLVSGAPIAENDKASLSIADLVKDASHPALRPRQATTGGLAIPAVVAPVTPWSRTFTTSINPKMIRFLSPPNMQFGQASTLNVTSNVTIPEIRAITTTDSVVTKIDPNATFASFKIGANLPRPYGFEVDVPAYFNVTVTWAPDAVAAGANSSLSANSTFNVAGTGAVTSPFRGALSNGTFSNGTQFQPFPVLPLAPGAAVPGAGRQPVAAQPGIQPANSLEFPTPVEEPGTQGASPLGEAPFGPEVDPEGSEFTGDGSVPWNSEGVISEAPPSPEAGVAPSAPPFPNDGFSQEAPAFPDTEELLWPSVAGAGTQPPTSPFEEDPGAGPQPPISPFAEDPDIEDPMDEDSIPDLSDAEVAGGEWGDGPGAAPVAAPGGQPWTGPGEEPVVGPGANQWEDAAAGAQEDPSESSGDDWSDLGGEGVGAEDFAEPTGPTQPAAQEFAQPGAPVQPAAEDFAQPGARTQPGAAQPAVANPAAWPSAPAQPAAWPSNPAQPAAWPPVGAQPAAPQPAGAPLAAAQPAVANPVVAQPAVAPVAPVQPAAAPVAPVQPAAAPVAPVQPAAAQPAAAQPAAAQPAAAPPAAAPPAAAQPAAAQPAAAQPSAPLSLPVSSKPGGSPINIADGWENLNPSEIQTS